MPRIQSRNNSAFSLIRCRLAYLLLGSLIVLFVYRLTIEAGHAFLCQREIERILNKIGAEFESDQSGIMVKHMRSRYSEDLWLLFVPASRSVVVCVDRQGVDDPQKTRVRELPLRTSHVPELVAIKISMDGGISIGPGQIRIDASDSGSLIFELPATDTLKMGLLTVFNNGSAPDLFTSDKHDGRIVLWDVDNVEPVICVDDECLLDIAHVRQSNEDKVLYGISLSSKP